MPVELLHNSLAETGRFHDLLSEFVKGWHEGSCDTQQFLATISHLQQLASQCSTAPAQQACADLLQLLTALKDHRQNADWLQQRLYDDQARLQSPSLDWDARRILLTGIQLWQRLLGNQLQIPRLIHFLKTDAEPGHIHAVNYLAIKSALLHCPDYRVILHTPVRPEGPLWEELLPHLDINTEVPPQQLGDIALSLAAHQADVWRVQKLIELGGFYFDWDLILLRSPETLRDNTCTMAVEGLVNYHREVLGVSAIGAVPQSVFLKCWLNGMAAAFNPQDYVAHSTVLAREIALRVPATIRVLSSSSFYFPGWTTEAMAWLFNTDKLLPDEDLQQKMQSAFGIHLFESHESFIKTAGMLNLEDLRNRQCNFTRLVAPILDGQL